MQYLSLGAFFCLCQAPISTRRKNENRETASFQGFPQTPLSPRPLLCQRVNPPDHAHEQPPCEMALCQHQPVVPCVLDQSAARLHQPLLQTGQRPVLGLLRQHQPPPEVSQVVGDEAQPEPHFIRPEPMATQPRHLHRLLAFLDPLLRRPPLVVEPHHRPAVRLQVGHDEPHTREQFAKVELHLRHHAPRRLPTRRLVEKAFVPDHRLMAWASHWPRQQFRDAERTQTCLAPGSRWTEYGWHTSRPAPPAPPRSPAWRTPGRPLGRARNTTSLPSFCYRGVPSGPSGRSSSSQSSALWTLPGRSFAARQSPSRLNSSSG